MIIGVIGSGHVGKAVGRLWAADGHTVYFGSRNPEKLQDEINNYGPHASVVTFTEAAKRADVIFSALPYDVAQKLYPTLAPLVKGKVVIEASNPFGVNNKGSIVSTLKEPAGEHSARLLPGSHLVRAFNHIVVDLIPTHGHRHPLPWAIPVAADSAGARQIANQLVKSAGYVPVNVGTLAESAVIDPGGELFLRMYTPYDMKKAISRLRSQKINTL